MMQKLNWSKTTVILGVCLLGGVSAAPAQKFNVLYTFTGGNHGGNPYAGVVRDSKGNIYGTVSQGGLDGEGAVFQVDKVDQEVAIYSFGTSDTYNASGNLLLDTAGNLYGVANGGDFGYGAVYRISAAGAYSTLYSFTGGTAGAYPNAGLIHDAGGNLYGTTSEGGANSCPGQQGCGTVFKLDPTGALTILYNFVGGTDGQFPDSTMVQDAAGNLYGTTIYGGDSSCGYGCGTVFKVNLAGQETLLHTFTGPDGQFPIGTLTRDAAGNLYGTTESGGDLSLCNGGGCGTVFRLEPNGVVDTLYAFTGGTDGEIPQSGVVQDKSGNLYGTTTQGGYKGCLGAVGPGCGTVFKVDKTGALTIEHTFRGNSDGAYCYGGVILGPTGILYGATNEGGDLNCFFGYGCGTVFEIVPK